MIGFLVAIVGLYVLERLFLLRDGQMAWLTGTGPARPRRLGREGGWTNRFGTLHFLSVVPDERLLIVVDDWPCALSTEGLTDGRRGFLVWGDVSEIQVEESTVLVNGRRAFRRATPDSARQLARFLEAVRTAVPDQRARMITDELALRLDFEAGRERIMEISEGTHVLRRLAGIFAMLWAIVLPGLLLVTGIGWVFVAALGAAVLLWFVSVGLVWAKLEGALADRLESIAQLALFAPATVRAAELVTRREDLGLDPLAIELGAEAPDLEWIRRRRSSLRYPLEREMPDSAAGRSTFESFRELQVAAVESCLDRAGIPPESLDVREDHDPQARSYCPRCHASFVQVGAHCRECDGLPTEPY